jgi:hypothetical protein
MATDPAEFGPSLPELIGQRWRGAPAWQKGVAFAVLAAVVLGAVAYYLNRHVSLEDVSFGGSAAAPPFSLEYEPPLREAPRRDGELVRLEQRLRGDLVQSLAIAPLRFSKLGGRVTARLPLDAVAYRRQLTRRLGGYRPVLEGATRARGVQGYQLVFTARSRTRGGIVRQLFGKVILLPEDSERPRRGIAIEMLATTGAGGADARALGNEGPLKTAYRSLELGG